MKTSFFSALSLLAVTAIVLSSCKKDEDQNSGTTNTHSYSYTDASGILVASKSYTYDLNGGYLNAIEAHTATAVFPVSAGSLSYNYAGIVKVQGKELTPTTNYIYSYVTMTDPINLAGDVTWDIGGGNNIPAFSFTQNKGIPYYNGLAELPVVVSKGAGATIDFGGKIGYADSVIVMLSGANSSVFKTVSGTAPNAIFQPAELAGLKATKAATYTVTPFNIRDTWVNGKRFYFVNETSYFKINIEIMD
jgi:hypothetical protein